uniref:acyl-coenzyme A thioesterase THEM4 n=1 Tax=Epinephelus lanceolatus TaxID=310571 RepID=UPI001446688B|nr:acyl-coenzyme A thioesterase THEM4 [Epinephelus lanceolatus]
MERLLNGPTGHKSKAQRFRGLPHPEPAKCGVYLSEMIQSKACFFTRNITDPGAAFEYAMFINIKEQKCVCIFQAGPLLEGAPGHVHGGAIAAVIDTVIAAHAAVHCGPVMTANFNINYRSPIPLGSTVLLESCVDKKEGRKIFLSCKVTSTDGSKVHTETTALFLTINASNLVQGVRHKHGSLPPEATTSE